MDDKAEARATSGLYRKRLISKYASISFLTLAVGSAGATYVTAFATDRLKNVVGVQGSEVAADGKTIAAEKIANDAAIVVVRQDVDRIYDLSKWLIGGLTISILSLAIVTFLTRKPSA